MGKNFIQRRPVHPSFPEYCPLALTFPQYRKPNIAPLLHVRVHPFPPLEWVSSLTFIGLAIRPLSR